MVEVLAAGISGAKWSLDAPSFTRGAESPGTGLTVIAIAPRLVDPGFEARLAAQLDRLAGHGVYIPGRAKGAARARAATEGIVVPRAVHERIAGHGPIRARSFQQRLGGKGQCPHLYRCAAPRILP